MDEPLAQLISAIHGLTLEVRELQLSNYQRAKEERELRSIVAELARIVVRAENEQIRADVAQKAG